MKEVSLTQNQKARVCDCHYHLVGGLKWHYTNGYAARRFGSPGRIIYMHRYLLSLTDGKKEVDHINGDRLDNQCSNLRIVSHQQNVHNSRGKGAGYKGVRREHRSIKYSARIRHNWKEIYLGCFSTQEEAALAYNVAALKYHGEYARLNIVPKELKDVGITKLKGKT